MSAEAKGPGYRYRRWAGNTKGDAYDPRYCAEEVWGQGRAPLPAQCGKKNGKGRGGLWCATHNPEKVAERERKRDEKYQAERDADNLKWKIKDAERAVIDAAKAWRGTPRDTPEGDVRATTLALAVDTLTASEGR